MREQVSGPRHHPRTFIGRRERGDMGGRSKVPVSQVREEEGRGEGGDCRETERVQGVEVIDGIDGVGSLIDQCAERSRTQQFGQVGMTALRRGRIATCSANQLLSACPMATFISCGDIVDVMLVDSRLKSTLLFTSVEPALFIHWHALNCNTTPQETHLRDSSLLGGRTLVVILYIANVLDQINPRDDGTDDALLHDCHSTRFRAPVSGAAISSSFLFAARIAPLLGDYQC